MLSPTAASFDAVCGDLAALLANEVANDHSMPGKLEDPRGFVTMGHLWDRKTWEAHRSQWRWWNFVGGWWRSTILKAMSLPLGFFVGWAAIVVLVNRCVWYFSDYHPLLRLPMTPLSLQATSIGLVLVFRTNQTSDRLREAQKHLGVMAAVEREILQMLLVHVPSEEVEVVCMVARYLAIFGWILKAELRDLDMQAYRELVAFALPAPELDWLFLHEKPTTAIIFRVRALVGGLYKRGSLDKEAFKFIEDDLGKLGDVCSAGSRLTTFPIPPSYHRHGSRSILMWLGAMPLGIEGKGHTALQNLCTVFITGFVVLGLDAIAIHSEQPFDVLPLYEFAQEMSRDVITVLNGWGQMPDSADMSALSNGTTNGNAGAESLSPQGGQLRQRAVVPAHALTHANVRSE